MKTAKRRFGRASNGWKPEKDVGNTKVLVGEWDVLLNFVDGFRDTCRCVVSCVFCHCFYLYIHLSSCRNFGWSYLVIEYVHFLLYSLVICTYIVSYVHLKPFLFPNLYHSCSKLHSLHHVSLIYLVNCINVCTYLFNSWLLLMYLFLSIWFLLFLCFSFEWHIVTPASKLNMKYSRHQQKTKTSMAPSANHQESDF